MHPVGHPTIITEDFGDDDEYFGIVKCKIIQKRELYLPVTLYLFQNKLVYDVYHFSTLNSQIRCSGSLLISFRNLNKRVVVVGRTMRRKKKKPVFLMSTPFFFFFFYSVTKELPIC